MNENKPLEDRIAKAADKVTRRFRRKHMADDLPYAAPGIARLFSRPHVNQAAGHSAAKELIELLDRWRAKHPPQ